MSLQAPHARYMVWITLFFATVFQIMPLPAVVEQWRPDWLLLVMIYWAMALPYRYNILTAWFMGVMLDILMGAHLGIRALAMSLVVYVVVLHCQKLRTFPVWQQSVIMACLVCVYHLAIFWLQFIVGDVHFTMDLFLPALSCLIIWPWVFWLLRRIRRSYKVR